MRGSHEGSLNAPRLKMVDADCIREVAERVVKQAAERGKCVIVGRGSAYYLQNRPDAFHVFIYAPFDEKVRRLRADGKTGEGSHPSCRDGRPRPRGLHQAIFRGRMARSPPLSSDGQLHARRGVGGRNNPREHCPVRQKRSWARRPGSTTKDIVIENGGSIASFSPTDRTPSLSSLPQAPPKEIAGLRR